MQFTRRAFVELAAAGVASCALAGCQSNDGDAASEAEAPDVISDVPFLGPSNEDLLAAMTMRQKLCQLIITQLRTWNGEPVHQLNDTLASLLTEYEFGGIIQFLENTTGGIEAVTRLMAAEREAVMAGKAGIAPLVAIDQEGGWIHRVASGTSMPGNMALGALGDADTTASVMQTMGDELVALGINVDFAPVADVNSNPANPIIGVRSFGDDPRQVAAMVQAGVAGLGRAGVASALKHFPGHGDTDTDSHTGLPRIDKTLDDLRECELVPFVSGIEAKADLIMTAHIQFPRIETETAVSKDTGEEIFLPATLSPAIVGGLLRDELGFKGVIVSDAMNMEAIATHFGVVDAMIRALNAGVDMLLMPFDLSSREGIEDCYTDMDELVERVEAGEVSEGRIDEAVLRVLDLKRRRGLMQPQVGLEAQVVNALAVVGCQEHRALEWEVAQRACTLVRNDDAALPIQAGEGKTVLVLHATDDKTDAVQYGCDLAFRKGLVPDGATIRRYSFDPDNGSSIQDYYADADEADYVIMICEAQSLAALDPSTYEGNQRLAVGAMADYLHDQDKQLVVISSHLPYDLAVFDGADALVACYGAKWLQGADAAPAGVEFMEWSPCYVVNVPAALCVALGERTPEGRLPVAIPAVDGSGEFTDEVAFDRGYGLVDWGF